MGLAAYAKPLVEPEVPTICDLQFPLEFENRNQGDRPNLAPVGAAMAQIFQAVCRRDRSYRSAVHREVHDRTTECHKSTWHSRNTLRSRRGLPELPNEQPYSQ